MIFVMDNTLSGLLSRTAHGTVTTLSCENLPQRYPFYFDYYPANSCKDLCINVYLTIKDRGFIIWPEGFGFGANCCL